MQITRDFDAPAQLVFDCHTKPELMRKWMMGPPGWSLAVCEVDLTIGGAFCCIYRSDADQQEFGVRGEFREIDAPVRVSHTERMDGIPGESLETLNLRESGAITTLTTTMLYSSREVRDEALQSGMADGMSECFERLEQLMSETEKVAS